MIKNNHILKKRIPKGKEDHSELKDKDFLVKIVNAIIQCRLKQKQKILNFFNATSVSKRQFKMQMNFQKSSHVKVIIKSSNAESA